LDQRQRKGNLRRPISSSGFGWPGAEEEEEDDDKNIIEKAAEKVVEEVKDTAKSVWGKLKSWSPWG
jgi:hypothetical protein